MLIKIGAKVVRHSRYVTFQMAEVAIDKRLFAEILSRLNDCDDVPVNIESFLVKTGGSCLLVVIFGAIHYMHSNLFDSFERKHLVSIVQISQFELIGWKIQSSSTSWF